MLTPFAACFPPGLYGGYYYTFVMGALMNETAVQLYKKVRPRFVANDGKTTPAWYNAAALALTARPPLRTHTETVSLVD